MGKIPVAKTKSDRAAFSTKVRMESSAKKNVCRGHRKRLLMLKRRISVLHDEKESLEAKNRELVDNLNTEKKLNAELQKDVFYWQRLYHETIISQNTYKVKHAEIIQSVTLCLKELKNAYPQLASLSSTLCRNQVRLTNLLNASRSLETEIHLPQAFGDGRQVSSDASKRSEKRMKHKVGPMVNGVLIQKPTIRLERVMLHQPQGQEPSNNDLSPERVNALTPIVEENEHENDSHLEQISIRRRRKHRLGNGERWRMRKQQELEKERQMERERERESQRPSETDSSDTDDRLGPVIRLQRISSLLLGSNVLEVDRGREEGIGSKSRTDPDLMRNGDDPKEGCSWMHGNVNSKHSKKKVIDPRKPESSATSDSSDEESDMLNVIPDKKIRSSLKNSSYKNKTFSINRKSSSSSSIVDMSHEASDASKVEPDSTNNIDDKVLARVSSTGSDSLGTIAMSAPPLCTIDVSVPSLCTNATSAPTDSTSGVKRSLALHANIFNNQASGIMVSSTPFPTAESVRQNQDQRRSSSLFSCSLAVSSPEVSGKRIRKPKNHLYPGEESANLTKPSSLRSEMKKGKHVKSSTSGRLSDGNKVVDKSSQIRSSQLESHSEVTQRPSQGRPSGLSQKKRTGKKLQKSSLKKKSEVSRTSAGEGLSQNQSECEGRPSRRNKVPTSYKEPPLNVKMRRQK